MCLPTSSATFFASSFDPERRSFSACNGVSRTDAEAAGPKSPSYSDSRESSWASSKRSGDGGGSGGGSIFYKN
jgi:hypothetical protein